MAARPRSHKISMPNLYYKLDKRTGRYIGNTNIHYPVVFLLQDIVRMKQNKLLLKQIPLLLNNVPDKY